MSRSMNSRWFFLRASEFLVNKRVIISTKKERNRVIRIEKNKKIVKRERENNKQRRRRKKKGNNFHTCLYFSNFILLFFYSFFFFFLNDLLLLFAWSFSCSLSFKVKVHFSSFASLSHGQTGTPKSSPFMPCVNDFIFKYWVKINLLQDSSNTHNQLLWAIKHFAPPPSPFFCHMIHVSCIQNDFL